MGTPAPAPAQTDARGNDERIDTGRPWSGLLQRCAQGRAWPPTGAQFVSIGLEGAGGVCQDEAEVRPHAAGEAHVILANAGVVRASPAIGLWAQRRTQLLGTLAVGPAERGLEGCDLGRLDASGDGRADGTALDVGREALTFFRDDAEQPVRQVDEVGL